MMNLFLLPATTLNRLYARGGWMMIILTVSWNITGGFGIQFFSNDYSIFPNAEFDTHFYFSDGEYYRAIVNDLFAILVAFHRFLRPLWWISCGTRAQIVGWNLHPMSLWWQMLTVQVSMVTECHKWRKSDSSTVVTLILFLCRSK